MKICYIFGALECRDACVQGSDIFVVAADAGYERTAGIKPDMVIGDFDSLGYVPGGVDVSVHPSRKDQTDTLLAVYEGLERGCGVFVIYGGVGGRIDHTIANIQTLSYIAEHGARGYLLSDEQVITVTGGELTFSPSMRGYISVFAAAGTPRVTITGLKYTLDRYVMSPSYPIGVSNEFIGAEAKISVEGGLAAVVWRQSASDLVRELAQ